MLMGSIASACTHTRPPLALRLYSPAPANNPLHVLNLQFAARSEACGLRTATTAIALPDSINTILSLPTGAKRDHLPIVTTIDFQLARRGAGPAWHGYPQASADLKFVAKLYDVGVGIEVRDPTLLSPQNLRGKRVGAPARPSAVRLLTEILLGDGWDVLDDVQIVDLSPPEAAAALARGEIDAHSWNLLIPSAAGLVPMLPTSGAGFISIDPMCLWRINAANTFSLDLITSPHGVPLLSFAQAIAAWDDTDPFIIDVILDCIARHAGLAPAFPRSARDMLAWPALDDTVLHPRARAFYGARRLWPN